jgi:predicted DsbA family dithiol-disulfide isomerase
VHRPFQLNPDLPEGPGQAVPAAEHYARKFGPRFRQVQERVAQAAAAEGIDYRADRILVANTLRAHRLLWLAAREGGPGLQEGLAEGLFRAYFTEGRDVSDPQALLAVAVGVGMDAARVRDLLAGDEGSAEVNEQIRGARDLGVTAVPTFVFDGRWAIVGAQEADAFLDVLRRCDASGGGS